MSDNKGDILINLLLEKEQIGMQVTDLDHLITILKFQTGEKKMDLTGVLHLGDNKQLDVDIPVNFQLTEDNNGNDN
tara:strand:- start:90 stop:317 length:228 start_codon:yes stop_codon:yes gene_type:complete